MENKWPTLHHNTSLKIKKRLWMGLTIARCDLSEAKLWFFWGNDFGNHQIFELDNASDILTHPQYNSARKTTLYIHGYVERMDVESIHVIVEAYQKRGNENLIVLDWGTLADGNYVLDAVQNARQLGAKLADVLIEMFTDGLDVQQFHLVGHSLGGQMAGMIGRNVIKKTNKTVILPRISALDPAFPPFYPSTFHISRKDALLVDVIHTDAWLYGAPVSTGTVDFWPNGGKTLQPGCPKRNYKMLSDNDLCSHRRSWRFWADSVANRNKLSFHSVKAKNWSAFKQGRIDDSAVVNMGIDCAANAAGDYYLQTNAELPFSRDLAGINYEKLEVLPVIEPSPPEPKYTMTSESKVATKSN